MLKHNLLKEKMKMLPRPPDSKNIYRFGLALPVELKALQWAIRDLSKPSKFSSSSPILYFAIFLTH